MKTKNVKVKPKDLRNGLTIYSVGRLANLDVEVIHIKGKVKTEKRFGNVYQTVPVAYDWQGSPFVSKGYLGDMGVVPYDFRRCFFKRKHAEEYARRLSINPKYLLSVAHREMCNATWRYDFDYDPSTD